MMMWKLNALLGECKDKGEAISYRDLSTTTGISTSTIYQIAQNQSTRADLKTIDAMLNFFSRKLGRELQTDDLLHHEPDA